MTDDEIIAVVQAHKEGKRIEYVSVNEDEKEINWREVLPTHIGFDFRNLLYRVAPEPRQPREWICFVNPDGRITPYDRPMTPRCLQVANTIRVREVIE